MIDHRPALIVRCATVDDVVAAVRTARENDLEIGVRCGGHNIAGLAVPHGGLMIDLAGSGPGRRRSASRSAPGCRAGRCSARWTAPPSASAWRPRPATCPTPGVGGLTLGGGMGWLARQHGLTCDNVVSCTVVTADGEVVRASADEHPDLFWGLRGGGGNFGIVVEFEFRLHPVGTRALVAESRLPARPRRRRRCAAGATWPSRPRAQATLTAEISGDAVTLGYVWVGDPDAGRVAAAGAARDRRARRARRCARSPTSRCKRATTTSRATRIGATGRATTCPSCPTAPSARCWTAIRPTRRCPTSAFRPTAARSPTSTTMPPRSAIAAPASNTSPARGGPIPTRTACAWQPRARAAAKLDPFAAGAYVNALSDEGAAGVRRAYSDAQRARLTARQGRLRPRQRLPPQPQHRPQRALTKGARPCAPQQGRHRGPR